MSGKLSFGLIVILVIMIAGGLLTVGIVYQNHQRRADLDDISQNDARVLRDFRTKIGLPTAQPGTVLYEVTGTASSAMVTYQTADGISQESGVTLPWSKSTAAHDGQFVSISAQNQGDSGAVIVTITRGDKTIRRSVSTGAYVIAEAHCSL